MNFLKYTLWPFIKVRLRFWAMVIRYGGKRNIPREVIVGQLDKRASRLRENLMLVLRHIPEDIDEKEKAELIDLIRASGELEDEIRRTRYI